MSSRPRPITAVLAGLLALGTIALLGGCGSSGGGDAEAAAAPDYGAALAGAPQPLARLHAQGGELLGGGLEAYERRLAELRGYPVVVNVWASWCNPCREEFPLLQRLSARYGKRVAFLGIDFQDDPDAAATFLRDHPVPYPSYTDPNEEIADSIGVNRGIPATAFYDREGELVFLKPGPYTDDSELAADIARHAPGKGG